MSHMLSKFSNLLGASSNQGVVKLLVGFFAAGVVIIAAGAVINLVRLLVS
jgi:hypothetical protein